MTKVDISDQTQAIVALESERQGLYTRAKQLTLDQEQTVKDYKEKMVRFSNHHRNIIAKMEALDNALFNMLRSL